MTIQSAALVRRAWNLDQYSGDLARALGGLLDCERADFARQHALGTLGENGGGDGGGAGAGDGGGSGAGDGGGSGDGSASASGDAAAGPGDAAAGPGDAAAGPGDAAAGPGDAAAAGPGDSTGGGNVLISAAETLAPASAPEISRAEYVAALSNTFAPSRDWAKDTSLIDDVSGSSLYGWYESSARAMRDSIYSRYFDPVRNVPGILAPDVFARRALHESVRQAGSGYTEASVIPIVEASIVESYLNQPALLALRKGETVDVMNRPDVQNAIAIGTEQANARWRATQHDDSLFSGLTNIAANLGPALRIAALVVPGFQGATWILDELASAAFAEAVAENVASTFVGDLAVNLGDDFTDFLPADFSDLVDFNPADYIDTGQMIGDELSQQAFDFGGPQIEPSPDEFSYPEPVNVAPGTSPFEPSIGPYPDEFSYPEPVNVAPGTSPFEPSIGPYPDEFSYPEPVNVPPGTSPFEPSSNVPYKNIVDTMRQIIGNASGNSPVHFPTGSASRAGEAAAATVTVARAAAARAAAARAATARAATARAAAARAATAGRAGPGLQFSGVADTLRANAVPLALFAAAAMLIYKRGPR